MWPRASVQDTYTGRLAYARSEVMRLFTLFVFLARPTLLTFGHATEGGGAGAGSDGAIGAGAGFGARFLAFALLASFAFFIPFFFAPGRRALSSWISLPSSNLPNRI